MTSLSLRIRTAIQRLLCALAATALLAPTIAFANPPRLATLVIDSGSNQTGFSTASLSPTFNPEVFEYFITIPFAHDQVQVNGATAAVEPGHDVSANIPESFPQNFTTQAIVSAVDGGPGGEQTDYVINVFRGLPNTNANLSNLTTSGFALAPAFDQAAFSYSGTVANSVTSLLINATTQDPGASIKINGTSSASGNPFLVNNLAVGSNQISVVVTSGDLSVVRTYVISVTRLDNPDSDMDGIPDAYETANGLTVGINDAKLDLDGDGLCNICEYAFGSDPDNFASHQFPVVTRTASGFLKITFNRAITPAQGLTFHVEVSSNLSSPWSSDVTDLTNPGTPQTQVWKDNFGGAATPPNTRFIRIRFASSL